jgi:cobalt-precorrin 5A hydrolase
VKTAIVTFSPQGTRLAAELAGRLADCDVYVHASVPAAPAPPFIPPEGGTKGGAGSRPVGMRSWTKFAKIADLAGQLVADYRGLVFIAPTGLAVRAVAPHLRHKTTDPAVVAVDVGGRWAISLVSGHEGGANDLALAVANVLGAEPVITTTTEAAKTIIVGVGCRRGVSAERIVEAVNEALARAGVAIEQVRLLASADIKADEPGLLEAARRLGVPVRFISSEEIRGSGREFARSEFVQRKVNLPAVAEPAALLAGRRTRLLLPKQTFTGVTVAVAAESCLWSE